MYPSPFRFVESRGPAYRVPKHEPHMRILAQFSVFTGVAILTVVLTLVACSKAEQEVAEDLGLVPDECGSAGARLEATVGGASYCASLQLVATGGEGTVIVTGVAADGSTLVVQFDELDPGTHAITEATNGLMWMQMGTSYTVAPGTEGVLEITAHDTALHVLKASFSAPLFNEMNGQTKQAAGSLDVVYTTGG